MEMAHTQNNALRSVMADAYADVWDGGTLTIRTGAAPGSNETATGTVLATITLPTPAFGAASNGVVAKAGTWQDASADADGTAAHYRMVSGSYVAEGTVTETGSGGDLEVDNAVFATGQSFTITSFSTTVGASS